MTIPSFLLQAATVPAGHSVSCLWCYHVSLQQQHTGAVVSGQDSGADVDMSSLKVVYLSGCLLQFTPLGEGSPGRGPAGGG